MEYTGLLSLWEVFESLRFKLNTEHEILQVISTNQSGLSAGLPSQMPTHSADLRMVGFL